jgi:hypothetical protein
MAGLLHLEATWSAGQQVFAFATIAATSTI